MTTQYQWALDLATRLITDKGTTADITHYQESLTDVKNNVSTTYNVPILFSESLLNRTGDTFVRSDRAMIKMINQGQPQPVPGDVLTIKSGRRYIVVTVSNVEPDGFPLYYNLAVEDGG